jgi:hypothetical protein
LRVTNFYAILGGMISEFLKTLGGPTRIAERLSETSGIHIERARVAMWGVNDSVPYRWRAALVAMARDDGKPVPPEVSEGVMVSSDDEAAA